MNPQPNAPALRTRGTPLTGDAPEEVRTVFPTEISKPFESAFELYRRVQGSA